MNLKNCVDQSKYKAIDLFAGIGGIRLGFSQAFGTEIKFVFSNEIDDNSCKTYMANFGEDSNPKGDITKVDPSKIPDFHILLGGFPCQAFSIAGRRKGFEDTRGTLFFYVAEILRVKQPDAFLLENVKNLVGHDNGRTFQVIKDVLTHDLHYHIHFQVLNAKDYGVPQNRERIYIVGFKKNLKFNFPEPSNTKVTLNDILEAKVDDSYYLSQQYLNGLKKHRARHEAKGHGFGYEVRPRDGIANAIVCGGMGKERNLVKDIILSNCWKKDGDSIQLRNNEGIRKMTEREWARLQGFPDTFQFPVAKAKANKQLGNSVAVPVIKAIAMEIKRSLESQVEDNSESIDTIDQLCLDLLEKMFEKKIFTKSGKKSIETIQDFVQKQALRIDNLDSILIHLKKHQIIDVYENSLVIFSKTVLSAQSKEEFHRKVVEALKSKNYTNKLEMYLEKCKTINCN